MRKNFQLFYYMEGPSSGDKAKLLFLTYDNKRKIFSLSDWWWLQFRELMEQDSEFSSSYSSSRFKNFHTVSYAPTMGKEDKLKKLYRKFILYRWRWVYCIPLLFGFAICFLGGLWWCIFKV